MSTTWASGSSPLSTRPTVLILRILIRCAIWLVLIPEATDRERRIGSILDLRPYFRILYVDLDPPPDAVALYAHCLHLFGSQHQRTGDLAHTLEALVHFIGFAGFQDKLVYRVLKVGQGFGVYVIAGMIDNQLITDLRHIGLAHSDLPVLVNLGEFARG